MKKYEYSEMKITLPESLKPIYDHDEIIKELTRLGAEGWLLVNSILWAENGNGTDTYRAIMAREIPE